MLWNLSLWLRTTDSNSQYSKTVLRPFIGPLFYGRLIDNEKWRLQFNESPNIFWSHDLNSPTAKSWSGFEFGNYANMEGTYKPAALSLDIHNWYVHGLNIKAAGASVSEGGVIIGSTLAWNPFSIWKTKMVFLNNLSIYARFREWGWQVQPTGIAAARKWWEEITFGFKLDLPFSIFE
jgi:hypothetical protein